MRHQEEGEWFYATFAAVAAGSSVPRAFLTSSRLKSGDARRAKMHIIRGLSPSTYTLSLRGWNALLRFVVKSHITNPSLVGPAAGRLIQMLYENRRLVEEWEARRRAYSFRGLIMMIILSIVLPFLIHISQLITLATRGGPPGPTPGFLSIWGLALLLTSTYLFATTVGSTRNLAFTFIPPIPYYISNIYASEMVSWFYNIGG